MSLQAKPFAGVAEVLKAQKNGATWEEISELLQKHIDELVDTGRKKCEELSKLQQLEFLALLELQIKLLNSIPS